MEMYTVKDINKIYKITEHYIREEIKRGNLKAIDFGRRAGSRITDGDLIEWMDSKRKTVGGKYS